MAERAVPDPARAGPFAARILPLAIGASTLLSTTMSFAPSISAEGRGRKNSRDDSLGVCRGQNLGNPKNKGALSNAEEVKKRAPIPARRKIQFTDTTPPTDGHPLARIGDSG